MFLEYVIFYKGIVVNLEHIVNSRSFKDTVLEVYDEIGECAIEMEFDELPGMRVTLSIEDERNIEDGE